MASEIANKNNNKKNETISKPIVVEEKIVVAAFKFVRATELRFLYATNCYNS